MQPRRMTGVALMVLALVASGCTVPEPDLSSAAPVVAEPGEPTVSPVETVQPTTSAVDPTEPPTETIPVDPDWHPLLQELVAFVQDTTGEELSIVADVEFTDTEELLREIKLQIPSAASAPPQLRVVFENADDLYRAAGLASVEYDMLDSQREVFDSVFAFYDSQRRVIVFPSPGGVEPSTLAVHERVILVHELTHALQAKSRFARSANYPDLAMVSALIEGEAEWVANQYIEQLSPEDRVEWDDFIRDRRGPQEGTIEILTAEFGQSYELGGRIFPMVEARHGQAGIEQLLRFEGVEGFVMLNPWAYEVPGERGFTVAGAPPVDHSEELLVLPPPFFFSAVRWYQMFARVMPGPLALAAAREITVLSEPAVWITSDDVTCFSMVTSAGEGPGENLFEALEIWVSIHPAERTLAFDENNDYVVSGCEPEIEAIPEPLVEPIQAIRQVGLVVDAELWAYENELDQFEGACVAWNFILAQPGDISREANRFLDDVDPTSLPAACAD